MGHPEGGKQGGRLIAPKKYLFLGEEISTPLRYEWQCPEGAGSGTKVRVERSDLVLRVGVSCMKTACGDKPILPLFGGIDATRATVSVTLVRRNTMYHPGCLPCASSHPEI